MLCEILDCTQLIWDFNQKYGTQVSKSQLKISLLSCGFATELPAHKKKWVVWMNTGKSNNDDCILNVALACYACYAYVRKSDFNSQL